MRIEAGSDFADLFEVKDALEKKGSYSSGSRTGRLVLGYERETFRRATAISATAPAKIDETGLTFAVQHRAAGDWTTDVDVVTALLDGRDSARQASGSAPGATCSATWSGGSTRRRGSSATGSR